MEELQQKRRQESGDKKENDIKEIHMRIEPTVGWL